MFQFTQGLSPHLLYMLKPINTFDPIIVELDSVLSNLNDSFSLGGDGVLRYQNRLCVPNVNDLWSSILAEAHGSRYSIHLGATKMYQDLKEVYW